MENVVKISNISEWIDCDHMANIMNLYPEPKLSYQPERLNPEDAKSVCDSPNSANK